MVDKVDMMDEMDRGEDAVVLGLCCTRPLVSGSELGVKKIFRQLLTTPFLELTSNA